MLAVINPWHGKIGRTYWWLSQLAIFCLGIGGLVATILLFADLNSDTDVRNSGEQAGIVVTILAVIYMNLCTCLNRLRDSGRSGIWYLSFLLPTVGTGLMVYFCGIEKHPGRFTSEPPRGTFGQTAPDKAPHRPSPATSWGNSSKPFGRRDRNVA